MRSAIGRTMSRKVLFRSFYSRKRERARARSRSAPFLPSCGISNVHGARRTSARHRPRRRIRAINFISRLYTGRVYESAALAPEATSAQRALEFSRVHFERSRLLFSDVRAAGDRSVNFRVDANAFSRASREKKKIIGGHKIFRAIAKIPVINNTTR